MQDKIIELLSRAGIDSHVIDMNEYSPANNSDAEFMQEVADYWAKKSTERVVRTKLANSSRLANFGSAPLPFQGQKSGFHREMVAHLKSVLTTDGGGMPLLIYSVVVVY